MPRPSSATVTELSAWIVTSTAVAEAGERLVDRVVDDLVDEVVQAALAGRADVHAGAQADRLESLEHRDVLRVVVAPLRALPSSVNRPPNTWQRPGRRSSRGRSGASRIRLQNNSTRGCPDRPVMDAIKSLLIS